MFAYLSLRGHISAQRRGGGADNRGVRATAIEGASSAGAAGAAPAGAPEERGNVCVRASLPSAGWRRAIARAARDGGDRDDAAGGCGPLSHQRPCALGAGDGRPPPAGSGELADRPVSAMAERILAGVTARGEPIARIALAAGPWGGADVAVVAAARGLEVTVTARSAAARRAIEAALGDLERALRERGLAVRRLAVVMAGAPPAPR
jgi:hypothetical protein